MLVTRLKVTTAPAEEPVTTAEAKAHLRVDASDEDTLIARLITAARIQCENEGHRAFVSRTYDGVLDGWPRRDVIQLAYPPLVSVTSITYIDSAGGSNTMPAADYFVDTITEPGRICLAYDANWPDATLRPRAAITIRFVAGYGAAAAVPAQYKQAILLLLAHLFENREAVIAGAGITISKLPLAVEALLMTDRGSF